MKKILLLSIMGIIAASLSGCRDNSTIGIDNDVTNVTTTEQQTEDEDVTIFDQIIAGAPLNDIESLYDFTDVVKIQDYYAVDSCTHNDNEIMVLYANEEKSMCVVYDISDGKEKKRIEMDVLLSLNAKAVAVSEKFSYIDEENGTYIYLDWKNEEYELIQLDDEPDSFLMLGEGEAVYYTVENDCNVYKYIYGSERCYSAYDGSDVVDSLILKNLISAGTSIILYVESEGYTGYAQLNIEMQELIPFDSLSGELIYNDNEYIYTVPEKPGSILLYNPMTPRLFKEFKIENFREIENLKFYREEGFFLTDIEEEEGVILRFYDLEAGILRNELEIPKEYQLLETEYFQNSLCVLAKCRNLDGEYKMLIWNTDIIEEILE